MFITKNEEIRFIYEALVKAELPEEDAKIVSESLTDANLRGVDSHGINRLPLYAKRIQHGLIHNKSSIKILKEDMVSAVIDAGHAMGQVAGKIGMELAIEKASKNTLGMVVVGNSSHFGAAAYYSKMASSKGLIGITASNVSPLMPPTGGVGKILGNNPICISAPAGKYGEITTDMAMSNVAYGKILNADVANKPIPLGWGVDKDGNPTTDPKDVLNGGFLLPVGGPKGYGLALMIEVLTSVLANSPVSKEIKPMSDLNAPQIISHTFIAINIKSLIDSDTYNERVETLLGYIKNCTKAPGVNEILIPGDIENRSTEKRLREGIPVGDDLVNELNVLAAELGIEPLKGGAANV